ncbi:neuropeptide FF receptor 1-like [Diadema setosum]|uniref:neuropeptide FF receptor 1-like n=1 Tax=Diadema setosum TaxID=31175 RepID=UPI003B3B05E8
MALGMEQETYPVTNSWIGVHSRLNGSQNQSAYEFFNNGSTYYEEVGTIEATPPQAEVSPVELFSKVAVIALNIVMTLIGNIIVIAIIIRNKHMRTATYYYLMNLAVADIIIAVFSEWTYLWGSLTNSWPIGGFMCRCSTFVQGLSVHVSILSLVVVAGDRYVAILHPIKSRVIKRNAWLVIAAVWLIASAINVPTLYYTHFLKYTWDNGVTVFYCFEHWGELDNKEIYRAKEIYSTIAFVVVYVLPLLILLVTYIRIGQTLSSRSTSGPGVAIQTTISAQDRSRRKVVRMLIVVVLAFALCWLPFHVYTLTIHWGTGSNRDVDFGLLWLGYANSAMNPFIYCGFNENFRRGFRYAFTGQWCFRRPRQTKVPIGAPTKSTVTTFTHSDHVDPTTLESML